MITSFIQIRQMEKNTGSHKISLQNMVQLKVKCTHQTSHVVLGTSNLVRGIRIGRRRTSFTQGKFRQVSSPLVNVLEDYLVLCSIFSHGSPSTTWINAMVSR